LFLEKDKEKIAGYRVCDCHDLLSASLAMTEEEGATSCEIIILAFNRFAMTGEEIGYICIKYLTGEDVGTSECDCHAYLRQAHSDNTVLCYTMTQNSLPVGWLNYF
jgi:hypothetical protein